MLKMQTILSNTKQCYIRISLNIRKRVKDIISARHEFMRVEGLRFLMDHAHSESTEWNLGCQENLVDSSIPSPFLHF